MAKKEEVSKKKQLIFEIYNKAYSKTHKGFFSEDYYHINPKPITMDNGKVVNVEWVQPSYWSDDVLINYRTDCLKTSQLSEKELEQILAVI